MRAYVDSRKLSGCIVLVLGALAHAVADAQSPQTLVECSGDRMSVTARNVKLSELLEQAAARCGFTLVITGTVDREISLGFRDLPVHVAFRRLLEGQDHVIEQTAAGRGRSVTTVRVLGTGATLGRRVSGTPPSAAEASPNPENLQVLRDSLHSRDADTREEAVHMLGESRNPDAVALLTPVLADPDDNVREAAYLAMANLGGPDVVTALVGVLADPRASARVAAVEALSQVRQPDVAAHLVPALRDRDDAVRESAFSALAGMEDAGVTEALGAVMSDSRAAVRLAAVDGLASIDGADASALLRRALTDADVSVRRAAAEALESRKELPSR